MHLEAPSHAINTCIARIDKEMIGLGQGTQVGKSSSGALESPRHDINSFIKRIDQEMICRINSPLRNRCCKLCHISIACRLHWLLRSWAAPRPCHKRLAALCIRSYLHVVPF